MSTGRKKTRTGAKKITQFEIIRPNVAGINVSDNDAMMVARIGHPKALVALARKIAVIYYRMMTTKEAYNPQLLIDYQEIYKERKIKNLEKYLAKLKGAV